MEDRRVVILEIIDVLRQHSAPSKRLRQSEILELLPHELTRKSLGQYLLILQEKGLVVKDNGYYWVSPWDGMSLRLLVDAIVWSKQIPKSYVDPLIDKVKAQAGLDEQKQLAAIVDSKKVYHQENEEMLSHLKVCDEAIESGRCLEIEYPTHTDKISPIKCVVNNDIYYVVCFAYRDKIETRRLDKMVKTRVLDEKSLSLEELYKMGYMTQIDDFLSGNIYLISGNREWITIECPKDKETMIRESLGFECQKVKENDYLVQLEFRANSSAIFYWALQYGEHVTVLAPQDLKKRLVDHYLNKLKEYQVV